MIFVNDGGVMFNEAAHFMGTNPLIRTAEIGLFAGLLLHIVQGLLIWRSNSSKRGVAYAVNPGNATAKWYSRSMGLLGTLILLFLIMHLYHFWVPSRITGLEETTTPSGETLHNLYIEMIGVFQVWWMVLIYVLGVGALGFHLVHGFRSAFHTLGLNYKKYDAFFRFTGTWFSIIICIIFAMMPLSIFFGIIQ
jgi:succinate dehydrogenase / fumarate reductase cytochrome b subunit